MVDSQEETKIESTAEKKRKLSFSIKFNQFSVYRMFGLFLILVPLLFYVGWNIFYNDWGDIGMYAFAAPTILFGILVVALGFEKERLHNQ